MATANSTTTPKPVLLAVPATTRMATLAAVLAPLNLCLHWRPDPKPSAPQARIRTAVGGAL